MHEYTDAVAGSLGGSSEAPKKELKHITVKKGKSGGHIITHHFTHHAHEPEDHVTKGDDQLAEHVLSHMGQPNPGEAEADAGQSGIPPAGGAAPAGGAMPPAGMPAA
jgi:hypothetical protein